MSTSNLQKSAKPEPGNLQISKTQTSQNKGHLANSSVFLKMTLDMYKYITYYQYIFSPIGTIISHDENKIYTSTFQKGAN